MANHICKSSVSTLLQCHCEQQMEQCSRPVNVVLSLCTSRPLDRNIFSVTQQPVELITCKGQCHPQIQRLTNTQTHSGTDSVLFYTVSHNYGNPWFLLYGFWMNTHKVIKFSTCLVGLVNTVKLAKTHY